MNEVEWDLKNRLAERRAVAKTIELLKERVHPDVVAVVDFLRDELTVIDDDLDYAWDDTSTNWMNLDEAWDDADRNWAWKPSR